MLRTREEFKKGRKVRILPLETLPDDALVVSLGGIGAPSVSVEKFEEGEECLRALYAVEEAVGRKVDALVPVEIGGSNAMEPMLTAAQAGLPVVDGDGMGRAFPEMQMTTWSIYGHESTPAAMADEKGNILVFQKTIDEVWLERLARAGVVVMGAAAGLATSPMTGAFVKRAAIPNTISLALSLGQSVLDAQRDNMDPIQTILDHQDGRLLITGKVVDLERHLKGGFSIGQLKIEGFDAFEGQFGQIDIQNEFLVFRRNGVVEISVPDLVVVLDVETGMPIGTEILRYGQRIAVLAIPCHPLLQTPEAIDVVGPKAFGYDDIDYEPMKKTK